MGLGGLSQNGPGGDGSKVRFHGEGVAIRGDEEEFAGECYKKRLGMFGTSLKMNSDCPGPLVVSIFPP